jgi:hypothetical protein
MGKAEADTEGWGLLYNSNAMVASTLLPSTLGIGLQVSEYLRNPLDFVIQPTTASVPLVMRLYPETD